MGVQFTSRVCLTGGRTGVSLENLVYYRSSGAFATSATHYFVMTTSADALHSFGV